LKKISVVSFDETESKIDIKNIVSKIAMENVLL